MLVFKVSGFFLLINNTSKIEIQKFSQEHFCTCKENKYKRLESFTI